MKQIWVFFGLILQPEMKRLEKLCQPFRKCSILLPSFDETFKNLSKLFRMLRKWSIYSWERLPTHISRIWCDTIKQIRVFVGFILQPEMKLLENRPRPLINIERDESSQTHLIVRDDPSGINECIDARIAHSASDHEVH